MTLLMYESLCLCSLLRLSIFESCQLLYRQVLIQSHTKLNPDVYFSDTPFAVTQHGAP